MVSIGTFASAPYPPLLGSKTLPRVCIVSGECVGPFRNGGLGTSMTGLAELLAAHGFSVTIVYTGEVTDGRAESWIEKYNGIGIRFLILDQMETPPIVGPLATRGWTAAYRLYVALQNYQFDVIHFNDTMGEALYCMVAKRLGLAFQDSLLCLALHSPTQWILELNGTLANWIGFTCFSQGERDSVRAADLLWGPSRYLLKWIFENGFASPPQVFNQQYVVPTARLFDPGLDKLALPKPPSLEARPPDTIVFFGRLEERKGIRVFCNALAAVGDELNERGIKVVFMGKPSTINGRSTLEYLNATSAAWPFTWELIDNYDQQRALDYLTTNHCVAVMPSPFDNSPCTVYEALQNNVPFLAARRGGIPELVHPDDGEKILFNYNTHDLVAHLRDVIRNGLAPARPAIPIDENRGRWIGMHLEWRAYLGAAPRNDQSTPAPRIAVFVDYSGPADELVETLDALEGCLGESLGRVAVVARGTATLPETLPVAVGLLIEDNGDPDIDAVDAWLRGGEEGILIFIRSGVILEPESMQTIGSASKNATWDALLATARVSDGSAEGIFPSIGSPAFLLLEDSLDGGAVIVRKSSLASIITPQALLAERPYFGVIDCLALAKCVLWPLPTPIVSMNAPRMVVWRGEQARRTMRYTEMMAHDRYFALGIGYWTYQSNFAPSIPRVAIADDQGGPVGRALAEAPHPSIVGLKRFVINIIGIDRATWLKNAGRRLGGG